MSGFELLRLVRRQFPSIRVIAMSGAYSGDKIPSGVAADAFYEKGRGIADLLKIMRILPQPERSAQQSGAAPSPVWIARFQRNASGEGYTTLECPECLGTFPKVLNGTIYPINEENCLFCGYPVRYSIFQAGDLAFLLPFQYERFAATPRFAGSRSSRYEAQRSKVKAIKRADTQTNRAQRTYSS
jgi:hypothetical protein